MGTETGECLNDIAKSDIYIDSVVSVSPQIVGVHNQSDHPNVHMITRDTFQFDLAQLATLAEKTIRCVYFEARGQAWSDGMDIMVVDDSGVRYKIGGSVKEKI